MLFVPEAKNYSASPGDKTEGKEEASNSSPSTKKKEREPFLRYKKQGANIRPFTGEKGSVSGACY